MNICSYRQEVCNHTCHGKLFILRPNGLKLNKYALFELKLLFTVVRYNFKWVKILIV